MKININLSPKISEVYSDILSDMDRFGADIRFRGMKGGRGSGKTRQAASMTAAVAVYFSQKKLKGNILCAREYMNSLADSSLEEIKTAIYENNMGFYFDVGEKYIRTADRRVSYLFAGLNRNVNSLKSKSNIILAWVDEAESVSEMAWAKLIPTVRGQRSEIWLTWNPETEDSSTDKRFGKDQIKHGKIVTVNYSDNPWFPEVLEKSRLADLENLDPATYAWIWEGAYRVESDAQILNGKVAVKEFEPEKNWGGPYYGLDWGFSQDPTAAIKCWTDDNILYIEYEAGKVGLELDDTAEYLISRMPGIEKYRIYADSARPESISHVKRNGLPFIKPVKKWPGSVEDGIAHLRSYKSIIIHPRCKQTIRESRLYSYKVDKNSGDVLPDIIDANNHFLDACIEKGQLVTTASGLVKIENIKAGDLVLTRSGFRRVLHHQLTQKNAEIWELRTRNRTIRGTGNHLVYCANKKDFVRLDAMSYNDCVITHNEGDASWWNRLYTRVKCIVDILTQNKDRTGFIIYAAGGGSTLTSTCTGRYGLTTTAKYQMGITFTILTIIQRTMILATLSALVLKSILPATLSTKKDLNLRALISQKLITWQKHGIQRQKDLNFIKRLAQCGRKIISRKIRFAFSAAWALLRKAITRQTSSALMHASRPVAGIAGSITLPRSASCADRNLSQTSTKEQGFAPERVLVVRRTQDRSDVYDIMVEDAEEFFASGVLVHNCRYALSPMIQRKKGFFS